MAAGAKVSFFFRDGGSRTVGNVLPVLHFLLFYVCKYIFAWRTV